MSSVDPLAAIAAQVAAMTDAAPADAALDLGAIAQVLQSQLAAGDVLEATVLAPKGGQDLMQILGQTVVAQLPPDVRPGEQLLLQVTGFQGNQILVRNLGVQDPQNRVPTFVLDLPLEAQTGTASTATLTTLTTPQAPAAPGSPGAPVQTQAAGQPTQPAAQPPAGPPVAPPREVFVAASVVRPNAAEPPAAPPLQMAGQPPAARAPVASPAAAATLAEQQAVPQQPVDIESRLAAARAVTADRAAPKQPLAPAAAASTTPGKAALPATTAQARAAAPPPVRTQAFSQTVFARAPAANVPATASAPPQTTAQTQAAHTAPAAASRVQLEAAVASKDPVRLLAALRIPATPVTLAAARAVNGAAQQITTALQSLERALSQPLPADARLSTLQTLTSFVAHLDPRNPQTFPAQISAFVSNVLDGAEGKLAQLLAALTSRAAHTAQHPGQGLQTPQAAQAESAPGAPAAGGAQTAAQAAANQIASAHTPIVAQARAAERQMALSQDLKATVLSLVANPPAGASAQLTQALTDTLTALTAMQFNTIVANQTDPANLVLNIPVMFYDGGQAANIRVQRDAPKKREALDADNFHIAFVLDTASLGTVAIDLETVGRAVKIAVKTDRATALDRIQTSLPDLTARLEQLRYRISSAGAGMVAAPAQHVEPAPEAAVPQKPANLDLQA